jgi:hypothetical protein
MKSAPFCNNLGFSLAELIVVMAMFVVIIAVTGDTFNRIMSHSSVQSKSAASNIEGIVSLEMMRKDLASTGFGLPWSFDVPITYREVNPGAGAREAIAAGYNGTPDTENQTTVPAALSGGNNITLGDSTKLMEGSDYLVIRATSIGSSAAAQRWSFMNYTSMSKPPTVSPQSWTKDNLADSDWVVVLKIGLSSSFSKELVTDSGSFTTQYNNLSGYEPDESKITNYIYGVSDGSEPRMPFNRADYYVRIPTPTDTNRLPQRCAPNTGILYKALVDQSNGTVSSPGSELPLLDCVADMQVVYVLDSSSNGQTTETDSLAGLSAKDIRDQLKSIQVYILTHEGGKDSFYTYPNNKIAVGPSSDGLTSGVGRSFDLSTAIGPGWERYRWKIFRFSVNPTNLAATL